MAWPCCSYGVRSGSRHWLLDGCRRAQTWDPGCRAAGEYVFHGSSRRTTVALRTRTPTPTQARLRCRVPVWHRAARPWTPAVDRSTQHGRFAAPGNRRGEAHDQACGAAQSRQASDPGVLPIDQWPSCDGHRRPRRAQGCRGDCSGRGSAVRCFGRPHAAIRFGVRFGVNP